MHADMSVFMVGLRPNSSTDLSLIRARFVFMALAVSDHLKLQVGLDFPILSLSEHRKQRLYH